MQKRAKISIVEIICVN